MNDQQKDITEGMSDIALDGAAAPSKKALKKALAQAEKDRKSRERQIREEQEKLEREKPNHSKEFYGDLPMNRSTEKTGRRWIGVSEISTAMDGQTVLVRARLQQVRVTGKKAFMLLRQKFDTVQGLSIVDEHTSKQMLKWLEGIPRESVVDVEATVKIAPELVKSCTVSECELLVLKCFVVSKPVERLPISIEDAARPDSTEDLATVNIDTRLNNRVIDLRTNVNQAIFKLQGVIVKLFREFLDAHGFTEIHSPKIISAASEGGASVFKVSYFKGEAYLAQSPQFFKQMAI